MSTDGVVLLSADDLAAIRQARALLEAPSLVQQMTELIGTPIEQLARKLPISLQQQIHASVIKALHQASRTAIWSLDQQADKPATLLGHKLAVAASGFAGGWFGVAGLLLEIPVSTTIMMRSIADIARSEGRNLQETSTQLACLEVFALGGARNKAAASDTAYYASRLALAELTELSAQELIEMSSQAGMPAFAAKQASKWLSRFIEAIASRFGVVITEKSAAQIVPVIGAATAATLNTLFMRHYQNLARGHFIIKRLEQDYGVEPVKQAYLDLARQGE